MTIQDQVKQHLEENHITYAEAGLMFKPFISKQYISNLLNSKNKSVPAKLVELIDALGLTLELKVKA